MNGSRNFNRSRKNGISIATAVCDAIELVIHACRRDMNRRVRVRIVHLLVGDGINTNENAGKRLLKRYGEIRRRSPNTYILIMMWKCPSHQSNLVVLVAIRGGLVKQATEVDAVCGTVSRLYKYTGVLG